MDEHLGRTKTNVIIDDVTGIPTDRRGVEIELLIHKSRQNE